MMKTITVVNIQTGAIETRPMTPDEITSTTPPPKPIAEIRTEKLAHLEASRNLEVVKPVTALGATWQADSRSQDLLSSAITLASAGLPLPTVWRDLNNVNLTITNISQLLAIAGAMATQTQAAYARSWQKKAEVEAASTPSAVDDVSW